MKTTKWFTLVELIVVITILSILWAIAYIALNWVSWEVQNTAKKKSLNEISKQLDIRSINHWLPNPVDAEWNKTEHWVIWYLTNKNSLWVQNLDSDENWISTVLWQKIFYTTDATWTYYALWILWQAIYAYNPIMPSANADEWKLAIIETNYPVDKNKFSLLWVYNKEINPTFNVATPNLDTDWDWVIELSEAWWSKVAKWFIVERTNWWVIIIPSDLDTSVKPAVSVNWTLIDESKVESVNDSYFIISDSSTNEIDIPINVDWYNNWVAQYTPAKSLLWLNQSIINNIRPNLRPNLPSSWWWNADTTAPSLNLVVNWWYFESRYWNSSFTGSNTLHIWFIFDEADIQSVSNLRIFEIKENFMVQTWSYITTEVTWIYTNDQTEALIVWTAWSSNEIEVHLQQKNNAWTVTYFKDWYYYVVTVEVSDWTNTTIVKSNIMSRSPITAYAPIFDTTTMRTTTEYERAPELISWWTQFFWLNETKDIVLTFDSSVIIEDLVVNDWWTINSTSINWNQVIINYTSADLETTMYNAISLEASNFSWWTTNVEIDIITRNTVLYFNLPPTVYASDAWWMIWYTLDIWQYLHNPANLTWSFVMTWSTLFTIDWNWLIYNQHAYDCDPYDANFDLLNNSCVHNTEVVFIPSNWESPVTTTPFQWIISNDE